MSGWVQISDEDYDRFRRLEAEYGRLADEFRKVSNDREAENLAWEELLGKRIEIREDQLSARIARRVTVTIDVSESFMLASGEHRLGVLRAIIERLAIALKHGILNACGHDLERVPIMRELGVRVAGKGWK